MRPRMDPLTSAGCLPLYGARSRWQSRLSAAFFLLYRHHLDQQILFCVDYCQAFFDIRYVLQHLLESGIQ